MTGADEQGAPITKYALEYKISSDVSYTLIDSVASPVTVSSLDTNTQYSFRVIAYNRHGSSTPSTDLTVTTNTDVPEAPINVLTAVSADELGIDISWDDGADNGLAISEYRIWVKQSDGVFSTETVNCDGETDATI